MSDTISLPEATEAVRASVDQRLLEAVTRALHTQLRSRSPEDAALAVTAWVDALTDGDNAREPRGGGMTAVRRRELIEQGVYTEKQLAAAERRVANGSLVRRIRDSKAALLDEALTAAEVAKLLGIDSSRVSHRRSDGALYAFQNGRTPFYPAWQFDGDRPLPNLTAVLAAAPHSIGPASLGGIMTRPQASLRDGDRVFTPRDWLIEGHNVDKVAAILSARTHR